ncbi:MAG: hypothetical protein LBP30_04605 [Clostridiales Family XIII bacterium]|jgi:DNA-binding transcriptional regulator of glucitol operon|nr:hypothetical protein [Clostridiales Family XIII bacterium]
MSRRLRLSPKTAALLVALLVVVAAVLIAAVAWYMQRMKQFEPGVETYHYDVGVRFEHAADAKISITNRGATLADGNKTYPLSANIVYYAGEKRALITTAMLAVSRDGRQGRVEYFAEADFGGENPVLRDGDDSIEIEGGFLFDGRDTYLFLEKGTLVVGETKLRFTPGACATVTYNANAEIYLQDAAEGISKNTEEKEVTAIMEGGYSIDLGKDILRKDNTELLLFTDPSMLAPLK